MCLAIANPQGLNIPEEHLQNSYDANADGAGFSVVEKGKVNIYKGYFTFPEFYDAFKYFEGKPSIVHFRWATHGVRNAFNCHPWGVIEQELSMIHNGIINVESTEEMSDTGHFVEFVLKPLLVKNPDLIYSKGFKNLLKLAVGSSNKLCFLDAKEQITIINEKSGLWDCGIWYSNEGYKTKKHIGYNWTPKRYQYDDAYYPADRDLASEDAWKAYQEETPLESDDNLGKQGGQSIWRDIRKDEIASWRAQGYTKRQAKRMVQKR